MAPIKARNPYETDPKKIPTTDDFAACLLYGRYHPNKGDFKPNPKHVLSETPEAIWDWDSLLDKCDESNLVARGSSSRRNVYAIGSVLIKTCRRGIDDNDEDIPDTEVLRDCSFSDENEALVLGIVRHRFPHLRVPRILFAGKIKDRATLIQERIPGVSLEVAWQYLNAEQKASFKSQIQAILCQLYAITSSYSAPGYVAADPSPVRNRGISDAEYDVLFEGVPSQTIKGKGIKRIRKEAGSAVPDFHLFHNNLKLSKFIVNSGKIVAVVGWGMAGYFAWGNVAKVSRLDRGNRKISAADLELLDGLYDEEPKVKGKEIAKVGTHSW